MKIKIGQFSSHALSLWAPKQEPYAAKCFDSLAMTLHYAAFLPGCLLHRIFRIPGALPYGAIQMHSFNLASVKTFLVCLQTVWSPKEKFYEVGSREGLHVSHAITYEPAGGLCVGQSLTFLSNYFKNGDLIEAAKVLRYGGNKSSVRVQALYEALLGIKGVLHRDELKDQCAYLLNQSHPVRNSKMQECLQAFLQSPGFKLRQFALQWFKERDLTITPSLYKNILELDAFWHSQESPTEKKYDEIHYAIIRSLAEKMDLVADETSRFEGTIENVHAQLLEREEGSWLIHFSNHTVALIQTTDEFAIFDPVQGLAVFTLRQKSGALKRLLDYYSHLGCISLRQVRISK
ncbi:MAG: hypothetical protein LW832_00660 [Parachlamydia sp.]|jgi:hypothetical protein|nr:hypothetical protein [Parachlamydia sp.]